MKYNIFDSPVGKLIISTDGIHITGLHIERDRYFNTAPSDWIQDSDEPILKQANVELQEYFLGKRTEFNLAISVQGTLFQKKVWNALTKIPICSTSTYAEIAKKIGKPKAVRAVGNAVAHNPICILIPCHRVIKRDGSLGGFTAGKECKQKLLKIEK